MRFSRRSAYISMLALALVFSLSIGVYLLLVHKLDHDTGKQLVLVLNGFDLVFLVNVKNR